MDKSALLGNLKIDRDAVPSNTGTGRRWMLVLAVTVVGLLSIVLVWFLIPSTKDPMVAAALVRPAAVDTSSTLLEASGYVVARRKATVSSKITGRVTEMLIEEGQHVDAGQVIARLDSSNAAAALNQAAAQVLAADANVQAARVDEANAHSKLLRAEKLHESGWTSDQFLEDAGAAYDSSRANTDYAERNARVAQAARSVAARNMDDTVVRAPFAGVVTVKAAQPGEIVSPISAGGGFTRTGIGTIVDMQSLEVEVDVAESYINRVKAGMPATVRLNSYPNWAIPAEVAAVIPTGDRSKATVKVRIRFNIEDPRIIPEMGAKVAFLNGAAPGSAHATGSFEIPADAVMSGPDDQHTVFVIGEDLRLARRTISIGQKHGDRQTVLKGLRSGERVAVGQLSDLREGMTVRIEED